jgi:hypothetical protein
MPATYYWVGIADTYPVPGDSSSWSDARNWDLNGQVGVGIPGGGDVAAFSHTVPRFDYPPGWGISATQPRNGTPIYDVAGGGTVRAVFLDVSWTSTGSLTINSPLTLTGASEWDSGPINIGTGVTLTNAGSLTLNDNIAPRDYGFRLIGNGTLANAAGATITNIGTNGPDLGSYSSHPTLTNQAGGTINFASDAGVFSDWAGATFINAGTLRKTVGAGGTASSIIDAGIAFDSSGTIDVEQGILKNEGNGSAYGPGGTFGGSAAAFSTGGTFIVASGATLDLTGSNAGLGAPVQYQGTYTGSGAGIILLAAGNGLKLTGDTQFNFSGTLFQWTGGYLDTNGHTLTNLGRINLSGSAGETLRGGGSLVNQGLVEQSGAGSLALYVNGSATTLTNNGRYDIAADSGIVSGNFAEFINNNGVFSKSAGSGTSVVNVVSGFGGGVFNNAGAVSAFAGTLDVEGVAQISGSTLTGGTWSAVAPGSLKLNNGTALTSSAGTVTLDGPGASFAGVTGSLAANSGTLSLLHGKTLTENASFTNSGKLTLGAGSLFTVPGYTQTNSGTFAVQASGIQYGQLRVTAGTVSLNGGLSIMSGLPFVPGRYVIIDNQTASPVQGTFANLSEGRLFAGIGGVYKIGYHGGDGNDVVLTALVPTDTPVDVLPPPGGPLNPFEPHA